MRISGPWHRYLAIGVVLASALALYLVSIGQQRGPFSALPDSGPVGRPVPEFALTALNGSIIRSNKLKGRPVVMTFLASWCPYCRSETPYLVAAAHQFGHRVTILGVDVDEKRPRAVHYAQTSHVSFPILLDRTGRVATRFDVVELPTTVFVNAQGRIIRVKAGAFMSRAAVTRMIQYLLLSSRMHHLQRRGARRPLRQ